MISESIWSIYASGRSGICGKEAVFEGKKSEKYLGSCFFVVTTVYFETTIQEILKFEDFIFFKWA